MKQNLKNRTARARLFAGSAVLLSLGAVGLGATLASAQTVSGSGTSTTGTATINGNTGAYGSTNGMGAYGTGWVNTVNAATNTLAGSASGTASMTGTANGGNAAFTTSANAGMGASAPSNPVPASGTAFPAPMVVSIDQNGSALVRGIVTSNSGASLSVQSWGGTWTLQSGGAGATSVAAGSSTGASDFSGIAVGDFVGAQGTISGTAGLTLNASFVRDWTTSPTSLGASSTVSGGTGTGGNVGAVSGSDSGSVSDTGSTTGTGSVTGTGTGAPSGVGSMLPQGVSLYTGAATNLNASNGTFTLTDASGQAHTVMTDQNTTWWDSASNDIGIGSMSENDPVRVDARANADGSLQAVVVRDTALGASASGATNFNSTQGTGSTTNGTTGNSGAGY